MSGESEVSGYVFDLVTDALVLFDADSGEILSVNGAARDLLGDGLVGQAVDDVATTGPGTASSPAGQVTRLDSGATLTAEWWFRPDGDAPLWSEVDLSHAAGEGVVLATIRETGRHGTSAGIQAVIQRITQAMVRGESRAELERRVCEIVAGSEPYLFAWVGEPDPASDQLVPRVWAGVEGGYLDDVVVTIDETDTGKGPSGEAIRTGEVAFVQNVQEDPAFEPWREHAVERDYQSSAAVPLVYEDQSYGMLAVYADRPFAFDPAERELLAGVGDDLAFALHAIEMQTQVERYSELTRHAPIGIFRSEAVEGGCIAEANPAFAKLLGADDVDELVGRPAGEFYASDAERQRVLDTAGTDEVLTDEVRLRTLDGEEVWALLTEIYYEDPEGTPYFDGAILDVTERNERIQQLRVLGRVLRHNLRNDMNVVRGHAENIRRATEAADAATNGSDVGGHDVRHEAGKIVQTADRLLDLAENAYTFDQVLLRDRTVPEPVDLAVVLRAVVERCRDRYPGADLEADLPETMRATAISAIATVFDELVTNALRHSDADTPSVTVSLATEADAVVVRIADDGPGIPDHERQVLTGERDVEPLYHGSGLGLWLVNWFVTRSGGTLHFESNDPRGSVVEVRLPRVETAWRGTERPCSE